MTPPDQIEIMFCSRNPFRERVPVADSRSPKKIRQAGAWSLQHGPVRMSNLKSTSCASKDCFSSLSSSTILDVRKQLAGNSFLISSVR